jgi:2-polyprenyl-3-methyl-5-hydroxy-6-metoxy-1,4-benzoquinol methylase
MFPALSYLSPLERQFMALSADVVELSRIPIHERLAARLAERNRQHYQAYDAQRISYAFSKAKSGEACLEVGPGRGDLTMLLAEEKVFKTLNAIDIEDQPRVAEIATFTKMSVVAMDFPDATFDMVYCMEVLEHLNDADLTKAISELRRVCGGHLLISVPFLEPMPSKYHLQKFTEDRVAALFPGARYSLLLKEPVIRVPWILIEEDHSAK